MPLLHRKPFVRRKPPVDLKPDEQVFYCKVTNEIFREYDDFFERTILCNSLVWSCAVTGKPGLTYQEALESESRARQNLQNFPGPLMVPILYLTTLTHCSRLHELCDDIYTYTKDRYFAGEIIEVTNSNGSRQTCKILEVVTSPVQNGTANGHISNRAEDVVIVISDESDNEDGSTSSAHTGKKKSKVDVSLFKYKVKPLKSEGNEIIIKAAQMNRKKNVYSRDKLKLFLKQHCELRHALLKVKSTAATKYKLSEQNFSHLFPDDPLAFPFSPTSRVRGRAAKHRGSFSNSQSDGATDGEGTPQYKNKSSREIERLRKHREEMKAMAKRRKEEEIASYLKKRKAEVLEAKKKEKEDKEKKREELKKILEEEKLKRKEEKERLKLEKEKVREKLREEKKKYAEYLKEWNKPREDMECEDLKELPYPMPVKTRLPSELFGDALMVLEFLNAFGELFDLQDEFPDGMSLEMLEEALVGNDTEGPLCELLFFFLSAIFQAHAEEEEEVAKEQLKEADTKDLTEALDEDADSTKCAVSAVAAFAAAWPQLYQGCTLRDLDLDSCTLSEILRLHILAAGADVTPANAKYRYQQQGGFDATDNACVEFRLSNPGLLKKLSNIPVYDLTAADKLKLLQALCGQLLTLVSTRDFIEDNVEILKQARQEFRELKAEQHRKEREEAAARYRKKKEERLKEQEQKIKEKHDQLKEEEQRNSKFNAVEEDETQEELETSTESRESAHRERGHDTATEDEEEVGPSKRGRKGRKSLNGLKDTPNHDETEEGGAEKREILTPEEEEAFKLEQQRKEKEMWGKIQIALSCTNIVPLGRDRLYRRYWALNSVPGLFVEEDFEGLTEDMLQPYPVKTAINNTQSQGNSRLSDTAPGNESSESGASGKVEQQPAEPYNTHNTHLSQDQNCFVSPLEPSQPSTSSQDQILDASSIELHKPVNKPNRWCVYSSPEQLDQLIEALNSRGKRESCLKESLHQEKIRLTELLTNFPMERFNIPDKVPVESKSARSSFKSVHNTNDASQLSAEKQLELRLKDLLLDIEDRTWQGTLGGIKAMGRDVWRVALESAHYALLGEAISTQNGVRVLENEMKENGAVKIENEEANDGMSIKSGSKDRFCELKTEARSTVSTSANTPQPVNLVVRYLAIALLHLERGIERKFLKPPLGEADEVKKEQKDKKKKDDKKRRDDDQSSEKDDASDGGKVQKTLLDRWRESLAASTSLAQVFLHLSTLDRSILWAKSLLNARCKICHKKGDAENMLLCDGCDRGHHTYCLRPKIKIIPEDDWFCPECRPKQRFRRPSARQRPALDTEEEMFEDLEEMEEEDEEESEEEEESEVEDDETEEEYEIERQPRRGRTRVKLQVKSKSSKGSITTVTHGQSTEPRRYPSRSRLNTPKLTPSAAKKGRGKKVGRPKSLPNAEAKPLVGLSGRMKSGRWSEGSFIELGLPRRRRRYRKAAPRTPEYGASTSRRLRRLSDLDNSQEEPVRKKRKYTRRVEQTTSPPMQSGKRGRKRKSTDTVVEVLKVTGNRRSSGRNSGIHELSVCEQLIVDLVRHEDSWPFLKLVNKAQVTDYYDIIKKPVALNIIREKLNRCQYNYASDFIDDVELMFTNCFEYNPRNTSEAKAGMKLQAFFHNQVEKLGLPVKPANVDHSPQLAATKRSRI